MNFKAGVFTNKHGYKSFSPEKINKGFEWKDKTIDSLLLKATKNLAELDVYSTLVPDIDFYIKMHVAKEATTSSRIEGTKTEIDEVFLSKEVIDPERRDDWVEVQNYIKAMNKAIAKLPQIPLSMRLLCESHKILLSGARGKNKNPGEIRKSQNWIGGANIESAFYVPPHPSEVPELLSDLEKYWHNSRIQTPDLIKIAISHYQFETIHPFLDGNGRIGRLLITLYLVDKAILKKPALYLSDYIEKNRAAYYDSLNLVHTTNDIEQWIRFLLVGIIQVSNSSKETLEAIVKLRDECESMVGKLGRRQEVGMRLLEYLYSQPIVTVGKISKELKISFPTAGAIIEEFQKIGILTERTGFKRNREFFFDEYLNIFKN